MKQYAPPGSVDGNVRKMDEPRGGGLGKATHHLTHKSVIKMKVNPSIQQFIHFFANLEGKEPGLHPPIGKDMKENGLYRLPSPSDSVVTIPIDRWVRRNYIAIWRDSQP